MVQLQLNDNLRKVLNIIKRIFWLIVVAVAIFMMVFTIISVTMFDEMDRNIFGYKMFIVLSDSMAATDFDAGDLIVSKKVKDFSQLKEGDIITFQSVDPSNLGEIVTHKIREVTTVDGYPAYITYGTTTDKNDPTPVPSSTVLGQYKFKIPNVGNFFQFLKTPQGYIICILIPFLLLILYQGLNCVRLFRQYRAEQLAELRSEREKLDAERLESQKMMEQLMALQAQLMQQGQAAVAANQAQEQKVETAEASNVSTIETDPADGQE